MSEDSTNPNRIIGRWNRVFEALSADPRRQLLDALIGAPAGRAVPLPGAAANPAVSVDHERLYQQLVHHHLPLLDDLKYVRWERDPLRAYCGPRFEEVEAVMQSIYSNADAFPRQLVDGCQTLEMKTECDD